MKNAFSKSLTLTSLIVLLVLLVSASAGEYPKSKAACDTAKVTKIVVPHFVFGGFGANVSDFNEKMTPYGFKRLKDFSYQFGVGGYHKVKRLILDWELIGTSWPEGRSETDKKISVYGLNGYLMVGVDLLNSKSFTLFPYLGGGTGRLFMDISDKEASMDALVQNKVFEYKLSQRTVVLDAGLGFDYTYGLKFKPDRKHVIGLRVGYAYDPSRSHDWQLEQTEIEHAPSLKMSGPYIRLVLGRSFSKPFHHGREQDKGCCAK